MFFLPLWHLWRNRFRGIVFFILSFKLLNNCPVPKAFGTEYMDKTK